MRQILMLTAGVAAAAFTTPAVAAVPVYTTDFENGFSLMSGTGASAITPQATAKINSGQEYAAVGFRGTGTALTNHFAALGGGNGKDMSGNFIPSVGGLLFPTFQTVLNTLYTIDFDYGAIGAVGNGSQFISFAATNATNTLRDLAGNKINFVQDLVATDNLNTVFSNHYQVQFLGTGTAVALNIVGGGSKGDNADTLIDNFQVRAGAVPEASTWGMMLIGFGFAGTALRRRRRSFISAAQGV